VQAQFKIRTQLRQGEIDLLLKQISNSLKIILDNKQKKQHVFGYIQNSNNNLIILLTFY